MTFTPGVVISLSFGVKRCPALWFYMMKMLESLSGWRCRPAVTSAPWTYSWLLSAENAGRYSGATHFSSLRWWLCVCPLQSSVPAASRSLSVAGDEPGASVTAGPSGAEALPLHFHGGPHQRGLESKLFVSCLLCTAGLRSLRITESVSSVWQPRI